MRPIILIFFVFSACSSARPPLHQDPAYNITLARQRAAPSVPWVAWGAEAFERAAREGRFILIDVAAEWCHWCHVMDATTYRDPAVVAELTARFVPLKVDVDARPDLYARYAAWGWPATIVLSPQGEELGKYRGYLEPAELLHHLQTLRATPVAARRPGADLAPPVEALPWIGAHALQDLDATYDRRLGGWGRDWKRPIGPNLELELRRAAQGDARALQRARQTFAAQRALVDPIWGGLYQYSVRGIWTAPHYEKLMTIQAANLEATARGYQQTRDPALLADARGLATYLVTFLADADGLFHLSQDADVGSHDPTARFVDGHDYFPLDDAARRALGLPRVDPGRYAVANGLAIAAFAALYEATGDAADLAVAERAAEATVARLMDATGRLKRDTPHGRQVRYLMDAAALGRGLARLAEVHAHREAGNPLKPGDKSPAQIGRQRAILVVEAMLADFARPSGALVAATPDPDASGALARPEVDVRQAIAGARALSSLARVTGDPVWQGQARRTLAAVATPGGLADEGLWIGFFLLALDEAGMMPWSVPPDTADVPAAEKAD